MLKSKVYYIRNLLSKRCGQLRNENLKLAISCLMHFLGLLSEILGLNVICNKYLDRIFSKIWKGTETLKWTEMTLKSFADKIPIIMVSVVNLCVLYTVCEKSIKWIFISLWKWSVSYIVTTFAPFFGLNSLIYDYFHA